MPTHTDIPPPNKALDTKPEWEYQQLPGVGRCDCCFTENVVRYIYTVDQSEYHLCEVCINGTIRYILTNTQLVTPVITMRFIAQCTNKILKTIREVNDTIQLANQPNEAVVIQPFHDLANCKDPARLVDPEGKVIDEPPVEPIEKTSMMEGDDDLFECIAGNPEVVEYIA